MTVSVSERTPALRFALRDGVEEPEVIASYSSQSKSSFGSLDMPPGLFLSSAISVICSFLPTYDSMRAGQVSVRGARRKRN